LGEPLSPRFLSAEVSLPQHASLGQLLLVGGMRRFPRQDDGRSRRLAAAEELPRRANRGGAEREQRHQRHQRRQEGDDLALARNDQVQSKNPHLGQRPHGAFGRRQRGGGSAGLARRRSQPRRPPTRLLGQGGNALGQGERTERLAADYPLRPSAATKVAFRSAKSDNHRTILKLAPV